MIELRRILVPVDFSDFSRLAVEYAAAVARRHGSEIEGLHVVPLLLPPPATADYPTWAGMSPRLKDRLANDLLRFLDLVAGSGLKTDTVAREGDIVEEIVREAGALPADLIVMGTHGRAGFQRWILGSTTEKVLRRAPCPVMTVCRPHGQPLQTGPELFRRVLCAVDFSEPSLRALDYALALAREDAGGQITVLHVVEALAEEEPATEIHFTVPEYRRILEGDARQRLHQAVPEEARSRCEVTELVVAGKASRAILRVAEEKGAGLIVMGAHGAGVLERLVFGSTSHHVVRGATCPVLTIRSEAPAH